MSVSVESVEKKIRGDISLSDAIGVLREEMNLNT